MHKQKDSLPTFARFVAYRFGTVAHDDAPAFKFHQTGAYLPDVTQAPPAPARNCDGTLRFERYAIEQIA
jgi:hypothetical protein